MKKKTQIKIRPKKTIEFAVLIGYGDDCDCLKYGDDCPVLYGVTCNWLYANMRAEAVRVWVAGSETVGVPAKKGAQGSSPSELTGLPAACI